MLLNSLINLRNNIYLEIIAISLIITYYFFHASLNDSFSNKLYVEQANKFIDLRQLVLKSIYPLHILAKRHEHVNILIYLETKPILIRIKE